MSFFSLENYTTYSILSGLMNPEVWVDRAVELGYEALGICDKNNMGGHINFQKQCDEAGIKPIFGSSWSLVDDCTEKEKGDEGTILLFIKDEQGMKNMVYLNNFANDNRKGFHHRPRLDIDVISEHCEGLIAVIPANYGAYATKPKKFAKFLLKASQAFGDDLYIGYNPQDDMGPDSQLYNLIRHETEKAIPLFHCHYPTEELGHLYDVVRMIDRDKRGWKNMDREVHRAYLPAEDDRRVPEHMLKNLDELQSKCDYRYPLGEYHMPDAPMEKAETIEDEIVWNLCVGVCNKLTNEHDAEGLWNLVNDLSESNGTELFESLIEVLRSSDATMTQKPLKRSQKYPEYVEVEEEYKVQTFIEPLSKYWERLEYEFGVIKKLGYLDYFLIVLDICRFVDQQGEDRGAARGSAAGSLFSYLLNITKVDPIEFGLLFERFLNEDRNDLPDIDLDFSSSGRAAIKDYIAERYGEDKVCSIGSYERYKVPSAIKAVCSAYGWSIPDEEDELVAYEDSYITKLFDYHVPQTARGMDELELRLDFEPFRLFYERHKTWFETTIIPLFETINNTSIHAAGTLVTAFPIDECMPIRRRSDGTILTQWKDRYCEERGFPKFDILAIKAVDIITYTKNLIKERHGKDIPDMEDIPLNDPKVFEIFQKACTDGVFQFKSWSQHQFLPEYRPDSFNEIVIATSVRRPGPEAVGADQDMIDIKKGLRQPEYDHPDMIPITEETQGFIIYQEQLMKTVQKIGGLNGSEADYVRKACGKKKLKDMQKWEEVFKTRAKERGYDEELLDRLWDKIVAFAEYGFNLSHSVSYCFTSYMHAWLKAYYPVEFWCAALKYAQTDAKRYDSVFNLKGRARGEGVKFIYPNLYGFADDFKPKPGSKHEIFWPLQSIKGIGESTTAAITAEGTRYHFDSLEDMVEKCKDDCHVGIFKKLIRAGFFLPIAETPWEAAQAVFDERNKQMGKKDELPYDLSHKNFADWQIVRNEVFGFVVSSWKDVAPFHPGVQRISEKEFKDIPDTEKVFVGGFVEDIKIRNEKNNKDRFFARITLTDDGEKFLIYIWSSLWMNQRLDHEDRRPNKGDLFEIIGEKDSWNDRPQIGCNNPKTYMRVVRKGER